MCGLIGAWTLRDFPAMRAALPRMTGALRHRGPDDSGHWFDFGAGLALGHRRLAIVDLSEHGHQPMLSCSGRYVLAFNGEIYNHSSLREELQKDAQAPEWRGHSDTETLLAAIERWGVPGTLERCTGMFAIALWDRNERDLWLGRDRLGEKPLYYGLQGGNLLFGSELKGFACAPGFSGDIDRDAIALLLRHNAIPAPYSIYRGISKLTPGTCLRVRQADLQAGRLPAPEAYWSLSRVAAAARCKPFSGTAVEAADALENLLGDVVAQQMMSDVPLGAFLSGGVDSSTIVALMQKRCSRPVKTFTIGFREKGYNEAEAAKAVARHLGTDHTELYVSAADAMAVIPSLPQIYCEPFSDSSQIPTYLVSRIASQHVTVSLSGDGGDELFLGYPRYKAADTMRRALLRLPAASRRTLAAIARNAPHSLVRLVSGLARLSSGDSRLQDLTPDRLLKLSHLLASNSVDGNYVRMMTHWDDAEDVVLRADDSATAYSTADWSIGSDDFPAALGQLDLQGYLPDDILAKVDRAAMATSLETRVPLLDHRVVQFALSLPLSMNWRSGQSKWLLRQVLYRHVPAALIERPKMGFGIPLGAWLRGSLRDWADALLSPSRLTQEGFFDPAPISQKWQEHLSGTRDWQYLLWDVLMFQAWLESQRARAAEPSVLSLVG
jgi:asparagine synthase (glutamine-hydrolysing)